MSRTRKLKDLKLYLVEERRFRVDMINKLKILNSFLALDPDDTFKDAKQWCKAVTGPL